jgi:hypothetical protein
MCPCCRNRPSDSGFCHDQSITRTITLLGRPLKLLDRTQRSGGHVYVARGDFLLPVEDKTCSPFGSLFKLHYAFMSRHSRDRSHCVICVCVSRRAGPRIAVNLIPKNTVGWLIMHKLIMHTNMRGTSIKIVVVSVYERLHNAYLPKVLIMH